MWLAGGQLGLVGISFMRQPLSLFAVIEQIRMNPLQLHNNSNVNPTVVWG